MSNYTTQVRFICESFANLNESSNSGDVDSVIDLSMDKVFDFEYPIFDESYRRVLQKKILKHYYTREICAETVGLWKLWLNTRLNEIMPYYNKLYKTEQLKFNPLHDVDITRTHSGSGSNTGNSKSSSDGTTWDKFSATPQGDVVGLENDEYLTSATKNTNKNKIESNTMINTTDEYVERVTGKQGGISYTSMIKSYRDILINIDTKIIGELSDLFMLIW